LHASFDSEAAEFSLAGIQIFLKWLILPNFSVCLDFSNSRLCDVSGWQFFAATPHSGANCSRKRQ
jgi:hypothetical protein